MHDLGIIYYRIKFNSKNVIKSEHVQLATKFPRWLIKGNF